LATKLDVKHQICSSYMKSISLYKQCFLSTENTVLKYNFFIYLCTANNQRSISKVHALCSTSFSLRSQWSYVV